MNIIGTNIFPKKKQRKKYLNIIDSNVMPCDSIKQIKSRQSVLLNYAKTNKVKIEIFDPRTMEFLQQYAPNSDLAACVGISVNKGKNTSNCKYDVIDFFKDEKTPFIKRVMISIQKLVTGDAGLPIEKEGIKTLARLKKMGIIKG